jgi:HK97 family phage major capsid protein
MAKELLHERMMNLITEARATYDNPNSTEDQIKAADKMADDAVQLQASLDKMNSLDAIQAKSKADISAFGGSKESAKNEKADAFKAEEYTSAFWNLMRTRPEEVDATMKAALRVGSNAAGGFTVPTLLSDLLIQKLDNAVVMRMLSTRLPTTATTDFPVVDTIGAPGWTAELADYTESEPTFGTKQMKAYKLTRLVKISEELLQDSIIDMDSFITSAFARSFAQAEDNAFIAQDAAGGGGTNRPLGIIHQASAGVAGAATTLTLDMILDLYHSLREGYRNNGSFLMKDTTVLALRKIKDTTGQYIWQPAVTANVQPTLSGRPVYTSEYMPAVGAGAISMLFGDFSYNWIGDRGVRTMQRLNELYAPAGQVGFVMRERVDSVLSLPEAVKKLTHA